MAVSSGMSDRKSDRISGKNTPKDFSENDKGELAAGTVEVILVCLLSGGIPFLILHILYGISVWAGFALETFWCYQLLATKISENREHESL